MADVSTKLNKWGMRGISILIAIPIALFRRKAVQRAYLVARPKATGRLLHEPGVTWRDATVWAALSAAGLVVGEAITRRGAESAWRVITHSEPPEASPRRKWRQRRKVKAIAASEATALAQEPSPAEVTAAAQLDRDADAARKQAAADAKAAAKDAKASAKQAKADAKASAKRAEDAIAPTSG